MKRHYILALFIGSLIFTANAMGFISIERAIYRTLGNTAFGAYFPYPEVNITTDHKLTIERNLSGTILNVDGVGEAWIDGYHLRNPKFFKNGFLIVGKEKETFLNRLLNKSVIKYPHVILRCLYFPNFHCSTIFNEHKIISSAQIYDGRTYVVAHSLFDFNRGDYVGPIDSTLYVCTNEMAFLDDCQTLLKDMRIGFLDLYFADGKIFLSAFYNNGHWTGDQTGFYNFDDDKNLNKSKNDQFDNRRCSILEFIDKKIYCYYPSGSDNIFNQYILYNSKFTADKVSYLLKSSSAYTYIEN